MKATRHEIPPNVQRVLKQLKLKQSALEFDIDDKGRVELIALEFETKGGCGTIEWKPNGALKSIFVSEACFDGGELEVSGNARGYDAAELKEVDRWIAFQEAQVKQAKAFRASLASLWVWASKEQK